jgi:hypothetical protein
VLNHLLGDPGHIRYFPCENIKIFLERSDEHEFLFGVELQANLELLIRIIGVSQNLFIIFILRCSLLLVVHLVIDGGWVEAEAMLTPFWDFVPMDTRGVLLVDGLDVYVFRGALPP